MRMPRILPAIVALAILIFPARTCALTGLGLGAKVGIVTDYKNPNLKLSGYKFDDLKYLGGFIKFGGDGLNLELGAEYYWDKAKLEIADQLVDVKARDFMLTGTGKFYFKFPVVKPFVGAGAALHRFTYTYNGPLGQFGNVEIHIPGDKAYLGLHIVVGAKLSLPVLPFSPFVEGKISRVNTSGEPTNFSVIAGGIILNLP